MQGFFFWNCKVGGTQLGSSMNSDRSLQNDFCYQIAGPHYWLNLLPSSFPIRAQRGSPATCCNGWQYGEVEECLGELRGREKRGEIPASFSVIQILHLPTVILHTPQKRTKMLQLPRAAPVQTQYDVMVLLNRRCLLIWGLIVLNQRHAALWNWIRGRFEFYFSALLDNSEEILKRSLLSSLQF